MCIRERELCEDAEYISYRQNDVLLKDGLLFSDLEVTEISMGGGGLAELVKASCKKA